MNIYVGLDIATITGYAIWYPKYQLAHVWQAKGDPVHQVKVLAHVLTQEKIQSATICIEELHHIQNHKTVVSLAERRGFIYWTLKGSGYNVVNVHSETARAKLKTKNKEQTFLKLKERFSGAILTSDMTDALAVALCRSVEEGYPLDWNGLKLVNYGGEQ